MRLIFVESNTTGTGMRALRSARELGLDPVLLAHDTSRYAGLAEAGAEVVACDTNSRSALHAAVSAHPRGSLAGITTTSEFYLEAAAWLAERHGLPGNTPGSIRDCRDKARFRRVMAAAGVPQPRFAVVSTEHQTEAAIDAVGLPCVVKPVDDSGSHNVKVCTRPQDAVSHVRTILALRTNVRGQQAARHALVEEYVDGPEVSVEMFGTADGVRCVGVVERELFGLPYRVEAQHIYPGARQEPIEAVARRVLRATGAQWGATHLELKLTEDGVRVIELNARPAGGMIPELIRLVDGQDLVGQQLRLAAGLPVRLAPRRTGHAGIRFLAVTRPGVLRHARGVEAAAGVPGVKEVLVSARPGQQVRPPRSSYDRLGHVIAHAATREELLRALGTACELIDFGEEIHDRAS
ncbi:ATP-grasp domain-containing protein [Nonomuraea sp. KM90]|uniref:ATP-grasp domain-containing protein n=1 Tax=Nonomuraea sp. KM90 TaxID=3457428 RepID=UPI003FCE66B1